MIRTLLFLLWLAGCTLSTAVGLPPAYTARILLIPLDDRPPCLQFTRQMALIGKADVVTPPLDLLGRFTTPGQSDKLLTWLQRQDLTSFDAAILSLDMLAYGGSVAARVNAVSVEQAGQRLDRLATLLAQTPTLKVYAQSVVMRLAPTADPKNAAYRSKLSRWAEISMATDPKAKAETARLETEIPARGLTDYKLARQRNLTINRRAVALVHRGVIDYLILSQDDAKPTGVHVADRETLIADVERLKLTNKISIQPGADEVSMLLLARALTKRAGYSPRINVVYSSEKMAQTVMPFEDRPLRETVRYHLNATGSREVAQNAGADVFLYVFTSRFEAGQADRFVGEIEQAIRRNRRVIVADVDPVGNTQGGDSTFVRLLETRHLLPELSGYASWNTAANTIGTALPQGVIFTLATTRLTNDSVPDNRIWTAQNWFLLHRVLDDYYFHTLIRAEANRFANQVGRSSTQMTDTMTQQVEAYALRRLRQSLGEVMSRYGQKRPGSLPTSVRCAQPTKLRFSLPWKRTFEARIDFDLTCTVSPEK